MAEGWGVEGGSARGRQIGRKGKSGPRVEEAVGREKLFSQADVDRFAAEFRASKPHKAARGGVGVRVGVGREVQATE